jgi:hypothetical protein
MEEEAPGVDELIEHGEETWEVSAHYHCFS